MKKSITLIIAFFFVITAGFSQNTPDWGKWNDLIGNWTGEGNGKPGQGSGLVNFSFDLDQKILVRKNHAEFPATATTPKVVHDDLMIIYPDFSGQPTSAVYFDNEGHTINYVVTYTTNSIVLTSAQIKDVPVFRLTYTLLEPGLVNTKFEMSQDGKNFMTYVEGKSMKTK